jgi:hypothetical protein
LLKRTLAGWSSSLIYYIYLWGVAGAYLGWRAGIGGWQIAAMVALVALQAWHLAALTIVLARLLPPTKIGRSGELVVYCMTGLVGLGVGYALLLCVTPAHHSHDLALVGLALPTGWISAAMHYGVILDSAAGRLFLAPAAVVWTYALGWLRRGFAIREFHIFSTGEIWPIFEYGLPNFREKKKKLRKARASDSLQPRATTEKQVLNSDALTPTDWRRGWFIERWIGHRLTAREKTLIEQFYEGRPRWTLAWVIVAIFSILLAMPLILDPVHSSEAGLSIFSRILLGIAIVADLVTYVCVRNRLQPVHAAALHPILPIGMGETVAALRKSFYFRMIFVAPLFALIVFAAGWSRPDRWTYLVSELLVLTIQAAACLAVVARARFGQLSHSPRFHWRRLCALVALSLAISLSLPLMFYVHWAISLPVAAIMLGCTSYACRQFDGLYVGSEFDFHTPNSLATAPGKS